MGTAQSTVQVRNMFMTGDMGTLNQLYNYMVFKSNVFDLNQPGQPYFEKLLGDKMCL